YHEAFCNENVILQAELEDRENAWHLYTVRVEGADPADLRQKIFDGLRRANIGVNVHYLPVYLHSYYRALGYPSGLCPVSERAYDSLLSLPMSHALSEEDQIRVIDRFTQLLREHA